MLLALGGQRGVPGQGAPYRARKEQEEEEEEGKVG